MTTLKIFRKPTIKLVLILAVLSVSAILLKNHKTSAVILINDEGFVPEKLSVKAGTTVVFQNAGVKPHWPASNFHPTHTLYPEPGGCIGSKFDACRGLKSGETFSFKLNIPGRWAIHDHLFPGMTMVIEVLDKTGSVPNSTPAPDFSKQGLPNASQFRALDYPIQLDLIKKSSQKDPVSTWQYIKTTFIVDGQVVGNAHEFAHIIGNQIYTQFGLSGIKNCDDTFAFGCYHGVTEKLLQQKGASVVKAVQAECLEIFPPKVNLLYTGCIHGMGHGLLTFESLNIKYALRDCDGLDVDYRPYCYDGVFMENATDNPKTAYDATDPWKLCRSLPDQYHYNCGRYQAQDLRKEFGSDLDKTAVACNKAPDELMKDPCFESIGFFVAQTAIGNIQKIVELCGTIKQAIASDICIIAAAKETIFQKYKDWNQASTELCSKVEISFKDKCLESNAKVKKMYQR